MPNLGSDWGCDKTSNIYNVSAASLLESDNDLHYGYLVKYNPKGKGQNRFCIIHKGIFFYYKGAESPKPNGFFRLNGYQAHIDKSGSHSRKFTLEHQKIAGARSYSFSCVSEKDVSNWVRILNNEHPLKVEGTQDDDGCPEVPLRTPQMDRGLQLLRNLALLEVKTTSVSSTDVSLQGSTDKLCDPLPGHQLSGENNSDTAACNVQNMNANEFFEEDDSDKDYISVNSCDLDDIDAKMDDYVKMASYTDMESTSDSTVMNCWAKSSTEEDNGYVMSHTEWSPTNMQTPAVPTGRSVPPSQYVHPHESVPNGCKHWYLQREQCSEFLSQFEAGTYIIRGTKNGGKNALAILVNKHPTKVKHFLIFENNNGKMFLEKEGPKFKTLQELISYYCYNTLPRTDAKLVNPCCYMKKDSNTSRAPKVHANVNTDFVREITVEDSLKTESESVMEYEESSSEDEDLYIKVM